MNKFTLKRLQEIEENGYNVDIEQLWGRGFQIWKKVTLPVLCGGLLFSIPLIIIMLLCIPWVFGMDYNGFISLAISSPNMLKMQFEAMSYNIDFQIRTQIFSLVIAIIISPLTPGFIRMCYDADIHDRINFGIIFKYYAPHYFWKIIVVTIIVFICTSIPSLFFDKLGIIGSMTNLIWTVMFTVFTALTIPLIIFSEASPFEALKTSVILVAKNIPIVLGFIVIGSIFGFLGLFLCCIGILFSMAYIHVTYYLLYKQIIGFEGPEIKDDIFVPENTNF